MPGSVVSKDCPSPQSQLKDTGVASTSIAVPSRVMLKVLFVGAGPYHHGLLENNENLAAGVTVNPRTMRNQTSDLFITDRGRPSSQGAHQCWLGQCTFRGRLQVFLLLHAIAGLGL